MLHLDMDVTSTRLNRPNRCILYFITIISILLGLSCLGGFLVTSIQWNLQSDIIQECKNDTQSTGLCFLRLIVSNAFHTDWDKFIIVSLLLTYASVLFHIITETNRTNITGPLGLMIIHVICIIFGIGVCFPLLFIPSYIYFYKSNNV